MEDLVQAHIAYHTQLITSRLRQWEQYKWENMPDEVFEFVSTAMEALTPIPNQTGLSMTTQANMLDAAFFIATRLDGFRAGNHRINIDMTRFIAAQEEFNLAWNPENTRVWKSSEIVTTGLLWKIITAVVQRDVLTLSNMAAFLNHKDTQSLIGQLGTLGSQTLRSKAGRVYGRYIASLP